MSPRTEAGQATLDLLITPTKEQVQTLVGAIEAEARAQGYREALEELADAMRPFESRLYAVKHGEGTSTDLYVEWWETFRAALLDRLSKGTDDTDGGTD